MATRLEHARYKDSPYICVRLNERTTWDITYTGAVTQDVVMYNMRRAILDNHTILLYLAL